MKVLLISSYKISCGIATYTETLETLLERNFDVTVHALDQSILKSRVPHVVETGDRLIRDLCAEFKNYDAINLQWEPGLLGFRQEHMAKRLGWILEAADNLILTVHTVVPYPERRSLGDFLRFIRRKGAKRAPFYFFDSERRYQNETYRILGDRAKSNKNTFVAVHTQREKQFFRNVVGFRDVFDHPLSLVHADWPERLRQDAPSARSDLEELFPGREKFIGVFGFLSEYKGFLTALRAMKLLEPDYQLLIYGGVHPETVKEREPVDSYVGKLMQEIEADALLAKGTKTTPKLEAEPQTMDEDADPTVSDPVKRPTDQIRNPNESTEVPVGVSSEKPIIDDIYAGRPSSTGSRAFGVNKAKLGNTLMEKVSFLGAPDDYEFALAINAVDICLFPYLEVGQSGSGPVSIAVELGKPTIVSRTKAFNEFAKYHPKHFEMIDIGNHIQLAQAVKRLSKMPASKEPVRYNNGTLATFYGDLIRNLAHGTASPTLAEPVRVQSS